MEAKQGAPDARAGQVGLLESVPVALLIVDDEGRIVLTNSALRKLFGYSPGELEGGLMEVLLPQEAAAGHPELRTAYMHVPYQRTMGSGADLEGLTKSRERLAIEVGLNAIEWGEGRHVVASVVDVTSLRAAQRRAQMAFDASASAMIMVNAANEIVLVNRQAVEVFGYREEELRGRPIEVLMPERLRRRHGVYRGSYLAMPVERPMGSDRALVGLRSDGREFPLEIGLTPLEAEGTSMVLATITDLTERLRSEEEITRQNADLRRLNEELGQFAYSASHDLKAPLATLSGLLDCLRDDLDDGDVASARELSVKAEGLAARLGTLIEGILGFARSEASDAAFGLVDLHDIVDLVASDLTAAFTVNGVDLHNNVAPGTMAWTDARRLSQALENLLSNGAKFADPEQDARFVAVDVTGDDQTLAITVSDNGVGIPADAHDQVFVMFRRFANHDQEGTGLGLALVKQHVAHLGGSISFESGPDGTIFTIKLPVGQPDEIALARPEAVSA